MNRTSIELTGNKEENAMQSTTDSWKTPTGKITIGGCGVLGGLLSICFVCIVSSVLIWPNEATREAALPPTEALTESLPTETPTEPLPTETPTEPLPTETPTELPPTEPPIEVPPTETSTPEVLKPVVTAVEGNVNLRNGPGTDYDVVGTLSPGESLEIVGRNVDSSWWQVSTPHSLAWVAAGVVTASNMDDRIPVAEAPPPPIQPTPTEPPPQPTVEPQQSSETVLDDSGDVYASGDLASHRSAEACSDCCAPTSEGYGDLAVNGGPTNPPAEEHADLNLALRGYELTDAYKGLVDYNGESDPKAPQLPGLFADNRTPTFSAVCQVYGWDWERKRPGPLVTDPEVTLVGLAVTPGETIHVPDSGYSIGSGYEVLVLYASSDRITLKYTPDDHVIEGYTLHVENICVEPSLLALYQAWNEAGRGHLPALRAGQAFGCARGSEIGVVIRDRGDFMDPRSRKDWWQGR